MPSRPSSSSAPREAPPTSLERVSTTRTRKPALLEPWLPRIIFAASLPVRFGLCYPSKSVSSRCPPMSISSSFTFEDSRCDTSLQESVLTCLQSTFVVLSDNCTIPLMLICHHRVSPSSSTPITAPRSCCHGWTVCWMRTRHTSSSTASPSSPRT
jgi:hypothetical protein